MKIIKILIVLFFLLVAVLLVSRMLVRAEDYTISTSGRLFVVNKLDRSITVFDLEKGKHLEEILLSTQPREIASTALPNKLAVTNYGSDLLAGKSISIINTETFNIEKQISFTEGTRPHGIVPFTKENKVMVATNGGSNVIVVDLDNETVLSSLHTNQEVSHMIAMHPFKNLSYVTQVNSGSVCVIDTKNNTVLHTIKCGNKTDGIAITPDGKEVWVTNLKDNTISIIDTKLNAVTKTISTGKDPYRLKFSLDGSHCYVTNAEDGTVVIYDRYLKKKLKTIQLPGKGNILDRFLYHTPRPVGILMHPNGKYAFIANSNANKIEIIDTETMQIVSTISTGKVPDSMALTLN